MRVVVFVVYVGESVDSVGGDGTFTATPPLGAPNGYRFGSALALRAATAVTVAWVVVGVPACLPAAPAFPPGSASQTAAPRTRAAATASRFRGRAYEM